jgi:hypothetical protein
VAVLAWRWELADDHAAYLKRSLTSQSDFAFVQRLLAEEGLFHWLERSGDAKQAAFRFYQPADAPPPPELPPPSLLEPLLELPPEDMPDDPPPPSFQPPAVPKATLAMRSTRFLGRRLRRVRAERTM